ncbi:LPS export ABC transporter periplasmic protein LptC [Phormidium sp. CLA17]|uniref:LPS export ABC transporter periplasmic protein LptC n=1 Tax=Leptolyngbya sp. Cla-17 TaxID=2803751 RepID=UPI001490B713|nr:LPS export ABC transporter periplasmic protein LptC [Leptolyngbya sp. Cla-17]MBM0743263.1 LPS export ABC transporter periplasmic protein LptC [Leptolyngbya sp. Cla-17]
MSSSLFSSRQWVKFSLVLLMGGLPFVAIACGGQSQTEKQLAKEAKSFEKESFDTDLTFAFVTLEEFDQKGQLWWKVKAKEATYSKDKKKARITDPKGEFFQDGKAILRISAQNGEVQQDGQRIFLRGNILATDLRDGLVIKGNELEWRPKEDLILVRNNVTGTRQKMAATAKNGKYLTRARRLDLEGNVVAISKEPSFQVTTDRLAWLVEKQQLSGDRALQMQRYEGKTVTDQASADGGEMDIKSETLTLKQSARLNIADPPMLVSGNQILWKIKDRKIFSDQPITFFGSKDNITLVGNKGDLDLKTRDLNLSGNVNGGGGVRQASLKSDRLKWNMDSQAFEADGNVIYRQAKPPLSLSGPKAKGTLKDQQVVVSGGRVVTQFVP